jgi:hypothetical protein
MACDDYYLEANYEFIKLMILHVAFIENNKHLLQSLTNTFFENFEFKEGKTIYNFENYGDIILTNILLSLRKSFTEMESRNAVRVINEAIEELDTHKILATSTNSILSDLVKPFRYRLMP